MPKYNEAELAVISEMSVQVCDGRDIDRYAETRQEISVPYGDGRQWWIASVWVSREMVAQAKSDAKEILAEYANG